MTGSDGWHVAGTIRLAAPGDVVTIKEPDYCYGLGDLRLRLTAVGDGKPVYEKAEWVQVAGVELTGDGKECGERRALVRGVGIGRAMSGWAGGALRPRIKPEHTPYRVAGGRVRVGGVVFGIASEIADSSGAVWSLLEAMDGSHSVDEIVAAVLAAHPACSARAVWAWLDRLASAGYVEDVGAPVPAELSERDTIRHDRARRFFRWVDLSGSTATWGPQVALRRARVVVVGVGGTGGGAALALAASGVGRLHLVDGDVVELSNLGRQVIYSEADIGRSKVDAAADRLRTLNSDIEVSTEARIVGGADDIAALAQGCDVLLLAADTPREMRPWTNRGCLRSGTAWVDAGYHGPRVQVGVYLPGRGACWECVREVERSRHRAVGAVPDGATTRRRGTAHAVCAVSAGVSGQLAAHAVMSVITGVPPIAAGRVHTVNLFDLGAAPLVLAGPRRPDCLACGPDPCP